MSKGGAGAKATTAVGTTPNIRAMPKGRFFEDFAVGLRLLHKWGRTFTREDAIRFATQTMNYNPLWFNLEHAKAEGHPDVVVCPWLVFNVALGMSVEDVSENATALLGYGEMVFHKDVYPGDTVTAESTVLETRASSSKPDQGILKTATTARNQRGETVLTYERTNLIRRRAPP